MGIFASSGSETNAEAVMAGVDSSLVHDAVLTCVAAGLLLSFGSSRDGGAVSIAVLGDGNKDRVWCNDAASLETALQAVVSLGNPPPAPSGASGGQRPSEGPTGASAGKAAGRSTTNGKGA